MPPSTPLLVYGAYGYTGALVVQRALARGLRPVVAGRDAAQLAGVAAAHGLEARAVPLDDPAALNRALDGIHVVLHCAGPFSRTSAPMVTACLRRGVHYLDITGEIGVFEAVAALDAEARAAGVMLLPGTGFDVVPSDCLAAHLRRRLPGATRLALAFRGLGGVSRGTATTMTENLGAGGAVRRGGRIVRVPAAWRTRRIDFGDGRPQLAVTIPWGDVSTAYHSTGIPDVEVYMAVTPAMRRGMLASRWLGWLLASAPVQRRLLRRIRQGRAGPGESARARGESRLWGEALHPDGRRVVSRLVAPEGYTLTAMTAVECAERALRGEAPVGFQTPSRAFGADFILGFDGVRREDVS